MAVAGLLELQQQGAQAGHFLVDRMDLLLRIGPLHPGLCSIPESQGTLRVLLLVVVWN